MISYTFVQEIKYPTLLKMSINSLALSTPLDHIDTNGTGASMNVNVWFADTLSEGDLTTLNSFMSGYSNPTISQDTINAINAQLQIDSQLLLVLRTKTITTVSVMTYGEIQGLCMLLGISP